MVDWIQHNMPNTLCILIHRPNDITVLTASLNSQHRRTGGWISVSGP